MTDQMTDQSANIERLIEKQTEALSRIDTYFSQSEVEKRQSKLRQLIAKSVAIIGISISGLFGGWELCGYLYEKYQIAEMANRYAEVADEIYYRENNPSVALSFVDKAIELNENNVDHRYLKSYIEGMASVRSLMNLDRPYTKEELDSAHHAVAQAVFLKRLAPDRAEPYILQGQIYAVLGEYDKALKELNKAVEINPQNDFAHVRLALLFSSQGKVDEALKEIERAISLQPNSKWGWLWKGVIHAEHQKNWDLARPAYRKALEIDPRFDLAWYNLAWTYIKEEPANYDKAREFFDKALRINPNYKEAYYGLGMVYGYQNKYDISKIYLDKALALDDKFLTGYKWRGIILGEMGDNKKALEDFSRAISISPGNAELYIRRAKAFEKLDEFDEAIMDLQFASDIEPSNKRIWLYLGNVFEKVGEKKKAIEFYSKAISLDPKYSEAYVGRAKSSEGLSEFEKSEKDFESAIGYASYRPERMYFERGKFFIRRKNYNAAIKDFQAARKLSPRMAEAWLSEAEMLVLIGDKKEALEAINHYIELRPEDKEGHNLKKSVTLN